MKRKSADFRRQATKEPYELELDSGDVVVFGDPGRFPTKNVWELARSDDALEQFFRLALSPDDHALWWAEWADRPQDETGELQADILTHFRSQPAGNG